MQTFGRTIVKFRWVILALAVILLIPSAFGFLHTRINYDILYYLPDDIETMEGQDILLDEFGKGAYGIFVCEGMSSDDLIRMQETLSQIDHVSDVISFQSLTGGMVPEELLPDELRDVFFSDDGTGSLMFIFFDSTSSSEETMQAVRDIRQAAGRQCLLSSMAAVVTDTKQLVQDQTGIYTTIAVVLALIVLMITMDSFLVPILFLLSIGMAIIYNLGTNIIAGEISYITMALVAILQLGVTMDYSIFLYNSYKEKKETCSDKKEAMAQAIAATIVSVTGSSLTTIAGFIAMCFMTFTLGMDMGLVMAKGVLIGVICCVTILPGLLLMFDGAITKTAHRYTLRLPQKPLSRVISKRYIPIAVILLLLWIPAIYGNHNVNVYYKLDTSLPEDLDSVRANAELDEHYGMNSVSMILMDAGLPVNDMDRMLTELNGVDGVNFVFGMDSVSGPLVPDEVIPDELRSTLESETHKLLLISSDYQVGTDEANAQCVEISRIIKSYDSGAMLVGESAATRDLISITDRDFKVVSFVSIGLIFALILFVLRSVSLPFILVIVVELAIYINMGLAYYTGVTLPFVASICVGTIQLGATIDYAILLTNRYKQERIAGHDRKEAVNTALGASMNSVFSSALGFFAATIGVAVYSNIDLIGSICLLLARGALLSMGIVLTLLPALLIIFDPVIIRTTMGMRSVAQREKAADKQ